jgi:hypothetical protein
MCKQAPKQPQSHFCGSACADDAEKNGPMILEVPVGHVTFKSGAYPSFFLPNTKLIAFSVTDQFKVFSFMIGKLIFTAV